MSSTCFLNYSNFLESFEAISPSNLTLLNQLLDNLAHATATDCGEFVGFAFGLQGEIKSQPLRIVCPARTAHAIAFCGGLNFWRLC